MKPYTLLWLAAIPVAILFWIFVPDTVDIHLSDTYYVTERGLVLAALLLYLLLFWCLYRLTRNWLWSNSLSWIHVVATVIACFTFTIAITGWNNEPPRSYVNVNADTVLLTIRGIVFSLLILAQLLFPVNLLLGIMRKI
ncbi:hypothetical protein [Chitinophaga vietnamensis]|uniref:hypothetical protein n=1 Tax=Chitinophaga vietnamensis TaxID=2593957 RepID=UPI0011779216|nr:hypothetical protein [Chitinophaga vietnamensis]